MRLSKMRGWRLSLVYLAIVLLIICYIQFYLLPVPSGVADRDDVMFIYAKSKFYKAISIAGELLGYGSVVENLRYLRKALSRAELPSAAYSDLNVTHINMDGVPGLAYEPDFKVANGPALVYFHGGGWCTGDVVFEDHTMVYLARKLGMVVISVQYRLAPENPFPIPFEDCLTATKFIFREADAFDINRNRIILAGTSAGGNLAAAVSLKLIRENFPHRPQIQMLIYPPTQAFDFDTPSYRKNAHSISLSKSWMISFWLWYGFGREGEKYHRTLFSNQHTSVEAKQSDYGKYVNIKNIPERFVDPSYISGKRDFGGREVWKAIRKTFLNPYFAPLMAQNLTGLPLTYIVTAEHDVLRDDGILFAQRLEDSGVEIHLRNYQRAFHGIFNIWRLLKDGKLILDDFISFVIKEI